MPESLVDSNIASDYSKLGKMLDICRGEITKITELLHIYLNNLLNWKAYGKAERG